MFPASLNIFHHIRIKENFFSENFFLRKGNARAVFLRSIEKINFRKPIGKCRLSPSSIDGKRCDIYPFLFIPPLFRLYYITTFSIRRLCLPIFFRKLCRSRLFFFCFRRNVFTPGFPRLRRQHFFPVAKSVYIVREEREKADDYG